MYHVLQHTGFLWHILVRLYGTNNEDQAQTTIMAVYLDEAQFAINQEKLIISGT